MRALRQNKQARRYVLRTRILAVPKRDDDY